MLLYDIQLMFSACCVMLKFSYSSFNVSLDCNVILFSLFSSKTIWITFHLDNQFLLK